MKPLHLSKSWIPVSMFLGLTLAVGLPLHAQPVCDGTEEPYVFFIFDTSGSMNWSPPCSTTQYINGECDFICPTGDCFVPTNGDDPASKLHQVKQALYEVVSTNSDALYGLATFNQDDLRVRDKHWLYTASDTQPDGSPNNFIYLLSGTTYPEVGAEEVFGHTWTCDEGSSIRERGCWSHPSRIADLNDPWEVRRARRLPKLGRDMDQNTVVYLRDVDGERYKFTYRAVSGGAPNLYGNAKLAVDIEVGRCINSSSVCATTFLDRRTVYYDLVSDFSSWDNGADKTPPRDGFFFQSNAADAIALNTCSGWDGNDDTAQDLYNGYDLRFPTFPDPPPLRFDTDGDGVLDLEDFSFGDVVPLDWADDHAQDVLARLAPNTVSNPTATPDFRVATYLNDLRQPGDAFLRLKDEDERPLVADGSTPLGNSMRDFRDYLEGTVSSPGFIDVASQFDPDFACRQKALVLLTDGLESCSSSSLACSEAANLYAQFGVKTFAVGYGVAGSGDTLDCIANNGGTGNALRPQNLQELIDALDGLFD